jgi:hypothetical protein
MLFSVLNLSANATPQFLDDRKIIDLICSPVSPPKTQFVHQIKPVQKYSNIVLVCIYILKLMLGNYTHFKSCLM